MEAQESGAHTHTRRQTGRQECEPNQDVIPNKSFYSESKNSKAMTTFRFGKSKLFPPFKHFCVQVWLGRYTLANEGGNSVKEGGKGSLLQN